MKQLSLSVTVLLACLTGASFRAHAQADESWYQAAVRHNALINKQRVAQSVTYPVVSKRSNMLGTGSRNIVNACDIITNGGFETQLAIPSHTNNMGGDFNTLYYNGIPYGATNTPDQLSNWYSPTAGSPDYFATNAATNSEVQPNNENSPYGSFTPYLATSNNDGLEGAIGLYARQSYYDSGSGGQRDRTSEYAQIDLGSAIPTGQYYVDFQVSISHTTTTSLATNYGVRNGFGLVFTDTPNLNIIAGSPTTPTLNSRDFLAVPNTAQTVFNRNPIDQNAINYGVTGAANWQRVSGQIAASSSLRYVTVGLFNADPSNLVSLPNHRTDLYNTYFFVDAIRVFKIPTAGQNITVNCSSPALIGEGCPIPGATYTWSAPGVTGLPSNSTSIQTTVRPTSTTTYTLTVNLPDQTSYSTQATVTVGGPAIPIIVENTTNTDRCRGYIGYTITNFNPAYQYSVNIVSGSIYAASANPTTSVFRIRAGIDTDGGYFNVTVNGCGGNVTTPLFPALFDCPTYNQAAKTTAYPNPAAEAITIPEGAENATLVNDKGKVLGTVGKDGKVDVQSLPDGLYNLQIMRDGKLINQRIQVKH